MIIVLYSFAEIFVLPKFIPFLIVEILVKSVLFNLGVGEFNLISIAFLKSDKSRVLVVNRGYLSKIGNKTSLMLFKSVTQKSYLLLSLAIACYRLLAQAIASDSKRETPIIIYFL